MTRRAIRILTEAYQRFSGSSAGALCRELNVIVKRTLDKPHNAYLIAPYPGEKRWTILLPEEQMSDAREAFLVFHEMAHLFLHAYGSMLPLGGGQYWEMECWCDNFAILMLFASAEYVLPTEEVGDYLGKVVFDATKDGVNQRAGEMINEMLASATTLPGPIRCSITELAEGLLAKEKRPA